MPQKGQSVANVVMDTTYFSDIGVMVFKNKSYMSRLSVARR